MGKLNSILKRSKFENLMAYLISEVGDNAEILDSFDDIINLSYETFFMRKNSKNSVSFLFLAVQNRTAIFIPTFRKMKAHKIIVK